MRITLDMENSLSEVSSFAGADHTNFQSCFGTSEGFLTKTACRG